jgi:hypothetical protein
MTITMPPNEMRLGAWSMFYLPPIGRGYRGTLTVTNRRLLYEATFDGSFKGMLDEAATVKWASESCLEINKDSIQSVKVLLKSTSQKCILTLADGSKHAFEDPHLDEVVAAIKARWPLPSIKDHPVRTFAKAAACSLAYLAVFLIIGSVVGVIVDFYSDVMGSIPFRRSNSSPAAFYAIWFVAGVFCGLLNYQSAGEILSPNEVAYLPGQDQNMNWTARGDATSTGILVIVATCVVLLALLIPFLMMSSWDELFEGYSLALTYFATVLGTEIVFHVSLRPKGKPSKRRL